LLAEHLRRARAVAVGPENILVTRGTGNGLDLCAQALLGAGTRAGVEDPGYHVARTVFAGRGAEVVPCPVDEDGVVVDALPDGLRSEEHTSELQSREKLVCRLLLEKKTYTTGRNRTG